MQLWRGLAAVGLGALALAGIALGSTLLAAEPARPAARELVMVAYGAFLLGTAGLLAATLARGVSQVTRAVGRARGAE